MEVRWSCEMAEKRAIVGRWKHPTERITMRLPWSCRPQGDLHGFFLSIGLSKQLGETHEAMTTPDNCRNQSARHGPGSLWRGAGWQSGRYASPGGSNGGVRSTHREPVVNGTAWDAAYISGIGAGNRVHCHPCIGHRTISHCRSRASGHARAHTHNDFSNRR